MTQPNEPTLTQAEAEVVRLRLKGKTYREIGEEMGLSHTEAWRHAQKPHVQAAIRGEHDDIIAAAKETIAAGYKLGLTALIDIASDPDHRDRTQAAKALVALVEPSRTHVTGTVETVQVSVVESVARELLDDE